LPQSTAANSSPRSENYCI